jgi:hypothetical protein
VQSSEPISVLQLIGFILTVTLIPLGVILGLAIRWLRRKKVAVTRQWAQEGVLFLRGPEGANFSGFESQGLAQVRGNGFIALTGEDLRLTRAIPAAEWCIPYQQIKQATLEPSFLGKRRGRPVLVITFERDGQPDRLGVYVRDGQAWVEAMSTLVG